MARQAKEKKKILNNQMCFDFENDCLKEHIIEEKVIKEEIKVLKIFRKENKAIKKCHLKRKTRKIK